MSTQRDFVDQVRWRLQIRGVVQGIGFRPHVYRLATQDHLTGWICNDSSGVTIEVQGESPQLEQFLDRLRAGSPVPQQLLEIDVKPIPIESQDATFTIAASQTSESARIALLPDLAICANCRGELLTQTNRRHRYPFISCVRCGPRYSIVCNLPFDRERTSLRDFPLCVECQAEYENPTDRRFHAQTIACHTCGPQVSLWNSQGDVLATCDEALRLTVQELQAGKILAVLGIGGFHLLVDATNEPAVYRLRERKGREAKPLAMMFSSLQHVLKICVAGPEELAALESPAAPIVLLQRRTEVDSGLAASVAPNSPLLGCVLAYSPLHVLLLEDFGGPVVATSGNQSHEAICFTPESALDCLSDIADCFLVHNRRIENPVDDSVLRVMCDRPIVFRRARGYVPFPLPSSSFGPEVIAVGAQQKNTIAIAHENEFHLGPHLGHLDSPSTIAAHQRSREQWTAWSKAKSLFTAHDLHPDYHSTRIANSLGLPTLAVQHHYAHALACMFEHGLEGSVLSVVWDGTGLGSDGTIWGGEFLVVDDRGFERRSSLRPFLLPGGEAAIREPRRAALSLLYEAGGATLVRQALEVWEPGFAPHEIDVLQSLMTRGRTSDKTTSAGRLFDAFASLLGLRHQCQFEAQAAMEFEYAAARSDTAEAIEFSVGQVIDWESALVATLEQLRSGRPMADLARAIHLGLANAIVALAEKVKLSRVVLSGGCFQNAVLLAATVTRLRASGFSPYWPQSIPPNDGGIAVGQLVAARRHFRGDSACAWRSREK